MIDPAWKAALVHIDFADELKVKLKDLVEKAKGMIPKDFQKTEAIEEFQENLNPLFENFIAH